MTQAIFMDTLLAPVLLVAGIGMLLMAFVIVLGERKFGSKLADEIEKRTKRLEDTSRRFRLMADNAYDLIAVCEANGKFEYLNAAFTRLLGYSKEELRGKEL